MTSPRRDRDRLTAEAEVAIDRMTAPLARGVAKSVRRWGVNGMTPLARVLIMRDVDKALGGIYGAYHGDTEGSALYRLVVSQAREAWRLAFARSVALLLTRLRGQPRLLRMIEAGDGR